jgi:hypothetical protein
MLISVIKILAMNPMTVLIILHLMVQIFESSLLIIDHGSSETPFLENITQPNDGDFKHIPETNHVPAIMKQSWIWNHGKLYYDDEQE